MSTLSHLNNSDLLDKSDYLTDRDNNFPNNNSFGTDKNKNNSFGVSLT